MPGPFHSYGSEIKENQLKSAEFWSDDEPGAFEDMSNLSITERGKRVAKSESMELGGKLHLDLAIQEEYLPNGLEFKLRLNRSSPQFCLKSDDSPAKIKIDTAILRVRNVQLPHAISNQLNQTIAHHNAKFSIRGVDVKLLQPVVAPDLKVKIIYSQVNFQNLFYWFSNEWGI